jgi:glycosyltransferase involved in cell wall biosynthesis/SAM-dependent methyltransferase
VPCYNQGQYLGEAIESARDQTYPSLEILVIDDGSTDDTADVAKRYDPAVRYIRQPNGGLAAARNTGLRESVGIYLVFLDADDRLLPRAVEAGIACLRAYPGSAFVSGHYRYIRTDGSIHREWAPSNGRGTEGYLALLRGNYIGMHATVMYRRDALERVGGFDTTLSACEDYDIYLRIARTCAVGRHDELVAEYRQHGGNMSRDSLLMRRMALAVLRRQWRFVKASGEHRRAYREGVRRWKRYYDDEMRRQVAATADAAAGPLGMVRRSLALWRLGGAPLIVRTLGGTMLRHSTRRLRALSRRGVAAAVLKTGAGSMRSPASIRSHSPAVGRARLADFRRVTPISPDYGYGRGLPVDRYYIERFLARWAGDVRGRVLEIGDDSYTRAYGAGRVTQSDVLHVRHGHPRATWVADLSCADDIPSELFDCVILTQTLHLIYDVRAALLTVHRILRPGGIVLATVPGISAIDHGEWGPTWYWSFTALAARRLFEETFPGGDVDVDVHGNVLAAVAFLHGLARQELADVELDHRDWHYPVTIAIRARKAALRPAHPA